MESLNDIVKGCREGKRPAQAALYNQFARKMYGVALLYTKDRDAAEDVLHDGFIKIFEHIATVKNTDAVEGWIRRIIVNQALERYRREHHLYAISDSESNTEEALIYNDVFEQISVNDLMVLVHELSPQYQMVFCLYAIDGYSHEEIGQMLGISEGTSKSNLSRARKILQDKIAQHYPITINKRNLC